MILALAEGFTATAAALARRAGIEARMPEPDPGHECGDVRRDVQVPGDPHASSAAVVTALDARARESDRWMAR
ncbi:hypothetical protein C1708_21035 [Streptomyces sp. DH-12]|nr:hypothetical protein C1708_21035 [Streptomyces sp. DH-12]